MRSKLFVLFFLVLVFLMKAPLVQGDIINGSFSNPNGLTGWTTDGNVSHDVVKEIAVLSTAGTDPGSMISLYQGTGVIPASSFLSFDFSFSTGTNEYPEESFFPDFFQVSFLDSLDQTSPILNPYFVAIDHQGPCDPETLLPLSLTTGVNNLYHFSVDISALANREGTLFFDLLNEDDNNDSIAYVDNVEITPAAVPEPATLILLVSGLISLLGFARRKRTLTCH